MPNPAHLIVPVLKEQGFVKQGSAFFRIHGDGIVQVLQYQRQSDGYYLFMGLHSMYELIILPDVETSDPEIKALISQLPLFNKY